MPRHQAPPRTLWIACGGTGGHFLPGAVVGRALSARGFAPLFWGEGKAIEADLCAAQGLSMARPGPGSRWHRFAALWRMMAAARREHRPEACLLFGGFTSLAMGTFALLRRVPYVIFEQNSVPGRANRLLSRCSRGLFLTFPGAGSRLSRRPPRFDTGNPVRPPVRAAGRDLDFLVLGGSQGSRAMNVALPAALPEGARVLHLCGPGPERLAEARSGYGGRAGVEVLEQHPDVPALMARSRWVVSRAGATSLAEAAAVGAALVAVPYPHAKDDHQRHNARYLESRGAALVKEDGDLPGSAAFFRALLAEDAREAALRQAILGTGIADPGGARALEGLAGLLGPGKSL